ncbi:Serine/threonine-protein kinase PrkC [Anatilimnocola aggregata]|uniref:Serine/threonine-protein kinase PrkC n=1 Tax=Anatilimnocola aggregata TaxID=2528021 RepID=A0A517YD88_9BACT|nr:serine/threonine-protein kinase [Anatilimnocola aggregata]QDU28092.1 Serine/threonine-protein kinase PrkC [Anatilimnocola aggregata]
MTQQADQIIAAREAELRCSQPMSLVTYWQQDSTSLHLSAAEQTELLFELCLLELEYSWRANSTSSVVTRISASGLVKEFPELAATKFFIPLTAEEFRARVRWGDRPTIQAFADQFSQHRLAIHEAAAVVSQQLTREFGPDFSTNKGLHSPAVARQPIPFDPRAPLSSADYLVQRFLGAGSIGRVYIAQQRSLQRTVALKFLRKAYLHNSLAVERFLQEARIAGGLRHPGIVSIHGLGRTPAGSYFIAMDYIQGLPLQPITQSNPTGFRELLSAIVQAAEAMATAHAQGVIHCDLKPANILQDGNGRTVLTDFGLARELSQANEVLALGEGTPICIAPEQVDNCWGNIGPATDVFGLAATLYLLLTGHSVHDGSTAAEVFADAVSGRQIVALDDNQVSFSSDLRNALSECLIKSPERRLQSMSELASRLRSIVQSLS